MPKPESDNLKQISVSWLNKHGYLNGVKSGTITWTNPWSGNKSSIGIAVSNWGEGYGHIKLSYTQTDLNGEKKDFDYEIKLTSTSCRYGGLRYWFICPLVDGGNPCGRRVGVLYKLGDYFGCRHCQELTYKSRNLGGLAKKAGRIISLPELEELNKEIKRFLG
jgi:hypothetical protein